MLCQNRPDGGIGPYFTIGSTKVLTSCFDDSILEPLGCWVFLLGTVVLLGVFWRRRQGVEDGLNRREAGMVPLDNSSKNEVTAPEPRTRLMWGGKWPKFRRFLLVITAFLMIALFAMHCLEIARLAANNQGIGLLPFCLPPLLIAFISLWVATPIWARGGWKRPARPHGLAWVSLMSFWMIWMVITNGIKLWSLNTVEMAIGQMAYDGPDSKYPYSDRMTDTVTILAVYAVLWLFYMHQMYFEYVRYDWARFW